MILFKKAKDLDKWLETRKKNNHLVGFVPTMGALHAGHTSLIETAKQENSVSVCSLFVNPTQFNNSKDFQKYPITIENDIAMLEIAGCDVLFLPSVQEMYPDHISPKIHYNLGYLETVLEGKFRPGHFQGVCMVVQRLLEIVKPDNLYLGQKDYQQSLIITKLAELINVDDKIKINIRPTLRENDGLAMSSRNMRLKEDERKKASTIYQSLLFIKDTIKKGNLTQVKQKAQALLEQAGFKTDYVEIADAQNLSLITDWDGEQKIVALIAAYINEIRLIDNMALN